MPNKITKKKSKKTKPDTYNYLFTVPVTVNRLSEDGQEMVPLDNADISVMVNDYTLEEAKTKFLELVSKVFAKKDFPKFKKIKISFLK